MAKTNFINFFQKPRSKLFMYQIGGMNYLFSNLFQIIWDRIKFLIFHAVLFIENSTSNILKKYCNFMKEYAPETFEPVYLTVTAGWFNRYLRVKIAPAFIGQVCFFISNNFPNHI